MRVSVSSSNPSTMFVKADFATVTNPYSLSLWCHLKCRPIIEFTAALTDVPSSAASSSRERTSDTGNLIVLRLVLRSSSLESGKRMAHEKRSSLILRCCLQCRDEALWRVVCCFDPVELQMASCCG